MSKTVRDLLRWDECATRYLVDGPKYQIAYELQLFRSRWRLAWHFQGFNAPDFSYATVDGYSAAFRVFLAYTAHEQLAKSIGSKHDFIPFEQHKLAHQVRGHVRGLEALTLAHARGKQREGLVDFWDATTDDVRFFAYGLRNLVAHGPPHSRRTRSRPRQPRAP